MFQGRTQVIRPAVFESPETPSREDPGSPLRALLAPHCEHDAQLPALPDLVAATISLGNGTRRKALLPVGAEPTELALVRDGDVVRISHYATGGMPEVFVLEREVSLSALLDACMRDARRRAAMEETPEASRGWLGLGERLAAIHLRRDVRPVRPLLRKGGAQEDPGSRIPLAFGFQASISPALDAGQDAHAFADAHALLFHGELWAYSRGKRVALVSGPVVLAVQRMVAAVQALVDAWLAGRGVNVRLRSGRFVVGARMSAQGPVALTLGADERTALTLPALDVPSAGLPVLRLASDLVRAVIAVDRTQARNLRLKELRAQVRRLRRMIRSRQRMHSFENHDPERLRLACAAEGSAAATDQRRTQAGPGPGRLSFGERWSAQIDSLDAAATFLCGDRIVLATPRQTLAMSRDDGEVLWIHPSPRGTVAMTGRVLLRLLPEGHVELCDVDDGRVFATAEIAPRTGGPPFALFAGGGSLPPVAVVAEGRQRLVALDLRTGETRWRFQARSQGAFRVRRAGRLLLVVTGEGCVDALDVVSGEVVWRFSDVLRFRMTPVLCGEMAVAVGGEPGGGKGKLYGVELYSGKLRWSRELETAPSADPVASESGVCVPLGRPGRAELVGADARDGRVLWRTEDPGIGDGGNAMPVDRELLINAPGGTLTCVGFDDGATKWQRGLSDPLTDDVPRQLEPILRNGALFVPAAQVHVLRPSDGGSLGALSSCDLVPDLLRVDERGWVYVAEESGHLRAYAPAPQLRLVKG